MKLAVIRRLREGLSTVKIVFTKGSDNGDFLTIIGATREVINLRYEREAIGVSECIVQYIVEDSFGIIGPIKMMASGIDPENPASSFTRAKVKVLCRALRDQLSGDQNDVTRFHQFVRDMSKGHGLSEFLPERASFNEAMYRLRRLDLLIQKLGDGGTIEMTLDL